MTDFVKKTVPAISITPIEQKHTKHARYFSYQNESFNVSPLIKRPMKSQLGKRLSNLQVQNHPEPDRQVQIICKQSKLEARNCVSRGKRVEPKDKNMTANGIYLNRSWDASQVQKQPNFNLDIRQAIKNLQINQKPSKEVSSIASNASKDKKNNFLTPQLQQQFYSLQSSALRIQGSQNESNQQKVGVIYPLGNFGLSKSFQSLQERVNISKDKMRKFQRRNPTHVRVSSVNHKEDEASNLKLIQKKYKEYLIQKQEEEESKKIQNQTQEQKNPLQQLKTQIIGQELQIPKPNLPLTFSDDLEQFSLTSTEENEDQEQKKLFNRKSKLQKQDNWLDSSYPNSRNSSFQIYPKSNTNKQESKQWQLKSATTENSSQKILQMKKRKQTQKIFFSQKDFQEMKEMKEVKEFKQMQDEEIYGNFLFAESSSNDKGQKHKIQRKQNRVKSNIQIRSTKGSLLKDQTTKDQTTKEKIVPDKITIEAIKPQTTSGIPHKQIQGFQILLNQDDEALQPQKNQEESGNNQTKFPIQRREFNKSNLSIVNKVQAIQKSIVLSPLIKFSQEEQQLTKKESLSSAVNADVENLKDDYEIVTPSFDIFQNSFQEKIQLARLKSLDQNLNSLEEIQILNQVNFDLSNKKAKKMIFTKTT